jgi:hypothetical protein
LTDAHGSPGWRAFPGHGSATGEGAVSASTCSASNTRPGAPSFAHLPVADSQVSAERRPLAWCCATRALTATPRPVISRAAAMRRARPRPKAVLRCGARSMQSTGLLGLARCALPRPHPERAQAGRGDRRRRSWRARGARSREIQGVGNWQAVVRSRTPCKLPEMLAPSAA